MKKNIRSFAIAIMVAMSLISTAFAAEVPVEVKYIASENTIRVEMPEGEEYRIIANAGDVKYSFASDGIVDIPVNFDGVYTIKVYKRIQGTQYRVISKFTVDVTESKNFLGTSEVVDMNKSQDVFKKKEVGAIHALKTDSAKAKATFTYVAKTLSYDKEKAAKVTGTYVPDNNRTSLEKKGICFDYAALYAAIMRNEGVPCKVVSGYIGDVYHAWNSVFLDGEWVFVDATWGEYAQTKYTRVLKLEW